VVALPTTAAAAKEEKESEREKRTLEIAQLGNLF
jgi:hypothetical protein